MDQIDISQLIKDIEKALDLTLRTPKDFDFLRERIYARLHILISSTTLKRIWGYLNDSGQPRESSLSILARFLGYSDWNDYFTQIGCPKTKESDPLMCRKLSVTEELTKGFRLRLTWHPDRICEVEYLGGIDFVVVESINTRLKNGCTFQCSLVVEGEPLYIDNLKIRNNPPMAYVCGKKTGVFFEIINTTDECDKT